MNKTLPQRKATLLKPSKWNNPFIILTLFILTSVSTFAQTITITSLSTGLAASPLQGGAQDQAIFGIQLAKSGGGTANFTQIALQLTQNPTGRFTNARIVRSDNGNSYDVADLANVRATGVFGASSITFTNNTDPYLTNFADDSGPIDRYFFVVVDIDPSVTAATAAVTPSVTQANITSNETVNAATLTGTSYAFAALETTITSLNAGANNVASSPLVPGATGQAVFGFSLSSNGDQVVEQLNIQLSNDPSGRLSTWSLVRSGDTDFATGGDNTTIGSLTFTPSATEVVITGLSEDVSTTQNYFLVANVGTNPEGTIEASLDDTQVTVDEGYAAGSATGTNYSFLTVAIGSLNGGSNNVAASPLIAGTTDQAIFGFSLLSGGTQTVSELYIQLSNDPTSKLSNWSLVRSGDDDFATSGDNVTIGSLTFTPSATEVVITGLSEDVSTLKNYFLVADVDASVTSATATVEASLGNGNITVDVGAATGSATGVTYSFDALTATIASLTTGIASNPLVGGNSNQAILGFSLSSNDTQNATLIQVRFDTDPDAIFDSYSLVSSTDNSFATTGDNTTVTLDAVPVVSGAGPFFLTFDPTTDIALSSTAKNYFVVGDVNNAVATASSVFQPSLTSADVTVDVGTVAGSSTGTDYDVEALTATIASVTTGVAPSPLVAGNTNQAILGFSLTSNGTQDATLIQVRFDTDPDATFNTYTLVQSTDNSFTTAGDNSTITLDAVPVVSGAGPFFLTFDPTTDISLSASAKNFFIVANVEGTVTNASSVIQPSLTSADVTVDVGAVSGSSTGTDYATQILTATIASLTTGVAASPLVGANVNQAILGFSLTSNGTQDATLIQVRFDTDPDAILNTYSLVQSTDNSFATAGDNSTVTLDAVPVVSGAGPFFLTFDPTTDISLSASVANFFIVANVDGSVGTASSVIQPSLTSADLTVDVGVTAGSSTGTDYSTVQLTTTIALASTGVAPSPLVGGNTNQAILGFSLTSNGNGTQNVTLLQARFDSDPDATFNTYSLVQSTDNSFASTGDNSIVALDAVPVVSGTGPFFITFDPTTIINVNTSAKYFFVVANVDVAVGNAASVIQPSLTASDVTVDAGFSAGSATGIDYSTAALTATLAQITSDPPVLPTTLLEAGQTTRVLTGFSVVSNGTQELSSINFNTSGLLGAGTNQFNNVYLYRSTTAGSVGAQLLSVADGDGNFNDLSLISAGNKTVTTSTSYYYLVVDVRNTVTTATAGVTVAPSEANIVFVTGGKNALSISRSFTFTQSSSSDIILAGGNVADINIVDANTADETPGEPVTTANSSVLATFTLRDGGASGDSDNLPTVLDGLTIQIENPDNLDQIALFDDGGTKISGTDRTPAATVNWTGLNYSTTTDNSSGGTRNFTIRASFKIIVTDNQQTDIDIIATTSAASSGSFFADTDAGGNGTSTTGNHNRIEVVSTKLVFVDPNDLPIINTVTPFTGPVFAVAEGQPGDDFNATVAAVDANNNLDFDRTTTITLTVAPSSGVVFEDDGAAVAPLALVNGVRTFDNLTIDDPNTYDMSAAGAAHTQATGATALEVVIQSAGVGVTPANLSMCKSTTSGVYQTLPDIILDEANNADFDIGSNLSFLLILPSGWEFNTTVTGNIAYTAGRNISAADAQFTFLGNTIAKFVYSVSNTNQDDLLTLSGLEVRNIGGFDGAITKGGTGVIKGCCDDSPTKRLGYLTTTAETLVSFSVEQYPGKPSIPSDATKFPKTSASQPIILNGELTPGNPDGTIGSFSGAGVSFINVPELAGNRYTFNPNILSIGNYPITFTYADGNGCLSDETKLFEVFDGAINGLQASYCADNTDPQDIKVNDVFRPSDATVVIDGDTAFSLQIPSYKYISEVVNNGGTMTVTVRNHGFSNGQTYWIYIANGFTTFTGPDAPYGYIYKECTVSNATTNTFDINVNVTGTWDKYYGIVYLPANYYLPFSNVINNAGTSLTITVPDHGFLNGAKPYLYVELFNISTGYSYLEGFFPIQNATQNTFDIPVSTNAANTWSGYGYVYSNWFRITTFVPDIKLLNRKLSTVNSYEVGYFVKYNWCTGTGCDIYYMVNQTPVQLNPLPFVDISSLDPLPAYCEGDIAVTVTGSESSTNAGTFTMVGGIGTITNIPNTGTATFDPQAQPLDTNLGIRYSYTDINGCTGTIVRPTLIRSKLAPPIANDTTYCQNIQSSQSVFTKASGITGAQINWYGNSALTDFRGTGETFNTSLSTASSQITEFFATQETTNSCESNSTTVEVTILPQPSANFSLPTLCAGKDFIATGAQDTGPTPYPEYVWSFGDGTSVVVANDNTVTYNYSTAGSKTIQLDVTDANGCTNSNTSTPNVNDNPIPTFSYNQVCENDQTQFNGQITTTETADAFAWNFYYLDFSVSPTDTVFLNSIPETPSSIPLSAPFGGTAQSPTFQFSEEAGEYLATVTAYNTIGCFSDSTRQITILEYLPHTTSSPYDMDDVDSGLGFWKIQDVSVNPSWEFASPTTTNMLALGSSWVTNADGTYSASENSILNSPCLDISGILRPTLSLDFVLNSERNKDGVVLEFSTDGGVTWNALGGPNSGLNWFNTAAFSTAPIGSSNVGWSGNSWEDLEDNALNDVIVQGRRALDNILSPAQRTKVRFRLAFKTDNFDEREGFGFNNFRIETRSRLLMVENFTNQNDPAYSINKDIFDNIDPIETVKIQYHVSSPPFGDANSKINSADQTARAGFYGLVLTDSNIPRAYIDGYSNGALAIEGGPNNGDTTVWALNRFDKRGLVPSPVDIVVQSVPSPEQGYLKAEVTITANQDIPNIPGLKPMLHIAVVEQLDGDGNEFVLRKFFTSPIGVPLPLPITLAQSIVIEDSVLVEAGMLDTDIALIAFIQDENNKDIYQTTIELNPVNVPTPITGVEDPTYANKINLFPNPANQEVNIELPAAVTRNTPVLMFDTYGRAVFESSFAPGERTRKVDTTELVGGMYIIQISTPEGNIARKKVMVVHR